MPRKGDRLSVAGVHNHFKLTYVGASGYVKDDFQNSVLSENQYKVLNFEAPSNFFVTFLAFPH